jgi:hypothetical protein
MWRKRIGTAAEDCGSHLSGGRPFADHMRYHLLLSGRQKGKSPDEPRTLRASSFTNARRRSRKLAAYFDASSLLFSD